ncbi:hypothetical protein SUGI_0061280 [Cryptomeria japonica]|nr:hypothetical protein SUGI_0061280 [Cryptomeria japonica]
MPIKDAVKSSVLSKRWRFLYTQMSDLTFSPTLVLGPDSPSLNSLLVSRLENIISNILLLHSHNLEAFHLHNNGFDHNQRRFSRENVCKWVRHASRCNIQHLTLSDHHVPALFCECCRALKETPPPALFSCSRLVTLYLYDYSLTSIPDNFDGFPCLITCRLKNVRLTDESLVSFISLCPLLQKLEITADDLLGSMSFLLSSGILKWTMEELVIYLGDIREIKMDAPLLNLFHMLPNLQRLHIMGSFLLECARDPIPDCLAFPHVNLKKIRVEVLEFDSKEIAAISCLLQSMPSLETMEIRLPDEDDEGRCMNFFKDILYLRRASLLARIIVLECTPNDYEDIPHWED